MRKEFFEPQFRQAAADYFLLLNKGYPEKRTRLLVADRYQLNTAQRTVLYRGVFPEEVNRRRRGKLVAALEIRQEKLLIDFLNLSYLLMNYLYGRNLFIATDGVLRDDGENYGEFSSVPIFNQVLELITAALTELDPAEVELVLDRPHLPPAFDLLSDAAALSAALSAVPAEIKVHMTAVADKYIRDQTDAVLVSADSRIIDRSDLRVCDLGYLILSRTYNAVFPNLTDLIQATDWKTPT